MRSQWGEHIVFANGHYWSMTSMGFYRATHWLARIPAADAVKPRRFCWGFHTTIRSCDADHANGYLPLHVLCNLPQYELGSLSPRRRNKVRNSYKQVEFVEVCSLEPLLAEGYDVVCSTQDRTAYRQWRTREQYQRYIDACLHKSRMTVVAGLIDGRIKGLAFCFAVGTTAYIHMVDIASDALKTNIGSGLLFEVAQIARRSRGLEELVNSPHTPEKPSLSEHKIGMGFDLVQIPSRVWFMPPTEKLVGVFRPAAYYRMTGKFQKQFRQAETVTQENVLLSSCE